MATLGRFRLEIVIPPETVDHRLETLLIKGADNNKRQTVGSPVAKQTGS